MKTPGKPPRKPFKGPAEGGAYVADAKSGRVKRDAFTRPAEWPKAEAAEAPAAHGKQAATAARPSSAALPSESRGAGGQPPAGGDAAVRTSKETKNA